MLNLATILDIIKNKDKMPVDQFEYFMSQASIELNNIGYCHTAMNGVDFKMLDQLVTTSAKLEEVAEENETLKKENIILADIFREVAIENYSLKQAMNNLKSSLKNKMIQAIRIL